MKRVVAAALLLAAAAFFAAGGHEMLGLDNLKSLRADFAQIYAQRPLLVLGGFFLFYLLLATLALPGGVPLTILAGALFGVVPAVLVVSFAASLGALLAFLLGRYLLRDWLESRYREGLSKLNEEIQRRGAYYLFTMRFVPVFPLVLVNYGSGLTRMRPWTYTWVSQLGMLPGHILFAAAGSGIAQLELDPDAWLPGLVWAIDLLRGR